MNHSFSVSAGVSAKNSGRRLRRRLIMGGIMVNYRPFYVLVRQFTNEKISKERFVLEWAMEQKAQGVGGTNGTIPKSQ